MRDDFLSSAEASFYRLLVSIYQDKLLVFPKVALGELFFVAHPDIHFSSYNLINQKRIDFLLCHPQTLKPLLAIELDDASHQRQDRRARDELVNQVFRDAGLPLLRITAQAGYDTRLLDEQIKMAALGVVAQAPPASQTDSKTGQDAQTPLCPKCGAIMVLRTARQGSQAGKQFYGCRNFPHCRGMLPLKATFPQE